MRGTSEHLGRRWQKAAALTLTLSLLNQQGLFISEAFAQAVVGRAAAGAVSAPVVPVVPVAPGFSAPTLAPLTAPTLSASPSLVLPAPVTPRAAAPASASVASVLPSAALAASAAPAVAATPASEPAALEHPLTLPSPAKGRGEQAVVPTAAQAGLRSLGGELAKNRGLGAPSLSLHFDGSRRAPANAVTEPVSRGRWSLSRTKLAPAAKEPGAKRSFVEFNVQYLKDIKKLFLESATKPNKQDYMFLATKTFGLNLAVRVAFAVKGISSGDLGLTRAIVSTAWYQLQDAFFTVFGQTYMKFLGKMTGMLRIGNAKVGDLLFVYIQLVASEFVNRLVLGPIGENPLVYSAGGIGLLLLNNLQGMVSGGLLVPVINKLRAAGLISDKTSNYLYQAASLTMHLGLLATFGYQSLFTILTTALMILSWSAYIGLSFFAKEKPQPEGKP